MNFIVSACQKFLAKDLSILRNSILLPKYCGTIEEAKTESIKCASFIIKAYVMSTAGARFCSTATLQHHNFWKSARRASERGDLHAKMVGNVSVCSAVFVAVAFASLSAVGASAYKTGEFESCSGGASGLCIDTDAFSCSVSTLTGKCNGGNAIRCCPSSGGFTKKQGTDTCSSNHANGHCKKTSDCTGANKVHTGLCDGPNGVACCAPASKNTDDDNKNNNG
jgi:hypothetical protein